MEASIHCQYAKYCAPSRLRILESAIVTLKLFIHLEFFSPFSLALSIIQEITFI